MHFKIDRVLGRSCGRYLWSVSFRGPSATSPVESKTIYFSLGYWIVAIILYRESWKGTKVDPFSPSGISFALLFLYGVSSAINASATGKTIYGEAITPEIFDKYYIACVLGALGLGLGFIYSSKPVLKPYLPGFIKRNLDDTCLPQQVLDLDYCRWHRSIPVSEERF